MTRISISTTSSPSYEAFPALPDTSQIQLPLPHRPVPASPHMHGFAMLFQLPSMRVCVCLRVRAPVECQLLPARVSACLSLTFGEEEARGGRHEHPRNSTARVGAGGGSAPPAPAINQSFTTRQLCHAPVFLV